MAFGKKNDKKDKKDNKPMATSQAKPDVAIDSEKNFADIKAAKDKKKRAGKKSLRNGLASAILVVVALVVLSFVIYHLYNYIAAKPEFSFITNGSVQHTIGARALIVRDEVLVGGGSEGDLVTQVTEGTRVATGQSLAMIVPEDMASVATDLRNTQSQLSEVQQELIAAGEGADAAAVFNETDEEIEPIIDKIREDAMAGNICNMSSYESSISVLTDTRETALASIDFADERINVLRNDAAVYEAQLESSSAIIYAQNPGIVSYKLDGLEADLNFDLMLTGNADTISDYISSSAGVITSDLVIEEGENAARIAQNEMQYLAVVLDSDDVAAADFAVDSIHTINIDSEGVVIENCVVARCEPCDDGLLIVFSTTRYVENLIDLRSADVEIVITESTGLCVAESSLVNPDYDRGIATIYVNNDGFCEEMSVIVVDHDREFAIIEPIGDASEPNRQTVIITNPSSVSPGEKVEN